VDLTTIVERAAKWYEEHVHQLSTVWARTEIRSHEPADTVRGKVLIQVSSTTTLATVTLWNKGEVEVIRLALPVKGDPLVVEDRQLAGAEDVALLLDSQLQQLAAPES
jgi:hypothetical protein